jgi:hypothetical protein
MTINTTAIKQGVAKGLPAAGLVLAKLFSDAISASGS